MPIRPLPLLRAGVNLVRTAAGADPIGEDASAQAALKQAGQIVVIFALMLTALIGLVGIAIDTTYAWRESLRVQRAADAAALAGVVYMPGDQDTAFSTATDNASLNVKVGNHAPTLDGAKTPTLTAELQGAGAPSGAVGTLLHGRRHERNT